MKSTETLPTRSFYTYENAYKISDHSLKYSLIYDGLSLTKKHKIHAQK